MRWYSIPLLSLMLGLSGCAASYPPCNRADVTAAYDASGKIRTDAIALSSACMERIRGDLNACYREGR